VFDVDNLVADAKAALTETEPRRAVRELLARTISTADAVGDALQPRRGGLDLLYVSDELTVLHVVWAPGMRLFPHDHQMWANIGIYAGQEDNTFYRRTDDDPRTVSESGGKELRVGDVLTLGTDAIHAVTNPLDRLTAAIHIYGGDFVNNPRSQWGPGPLEERPYDMETVNRQFAEANEAAGLTA
jgi:predicted metal-dependent enzyme (double-stranded beta helix superfamily)